MFPAAASWTERCGIQESCLWATAHLSQAGWGADPVLTNPRNNYSKSEPKDGLSNILGPVRGEIFCQVITQPVLLIC